MSFSQPVLIDNSFKWVARDFIFDLNSARTEASQVTFILDGLDVDQYYYEVKRYYVNFETSRPDVLMTDTPYPALKYRNDHYSQGGRRTLLQAKNVSNLTSVFKNREALIQTLGLQNIELKSYCRSYSNEEEGIPPTTYYSIELRLSLYEARLDKAVEVAKGLHSHNSILSRLPNEVVGEYIMSQAGDTIHRRLFFKTYQSNIFNFVVKLLQNEYRMQIDHLNHSLEGPKMAWYKKQLLFPVLYISQLVDIRKMFTRKMEEIKKTLMASWPRTPLEQQFRMTTVFPSETIDDTKAPWSDFLQNTTDDVEDLFTSVKYGLTRYALELNPDFPETKDSSLCVFLAFGKDDEGTQCVRVILPLTTSEFDIQEREVPGEPSQLNLVYYFNDSPSCYYKTFHYFVQKLVRWATSKTLLLADTSSISRVR